MIYEWIKVGKDYIRTKKIVNRWICNPPEEPNIRPISLIDKIGLTLQRVAFSQWQPPQIVDKNSLTYFLPFKSSIAYFDDKLFLAFVLIHPKHLLSKIINQ